MPLPRRIQTGGIILAMAVAWLAVGGMAAAQSLPLIPWPSSVEIQPGEFFLTSGVIFISDPGAASIATDLRRRIDLSIDDWTTTTTLRAFVNTRSSGVISIRLDPALSHLGPEGYRLRVTPNAIELRAPELAGLFYASRTLLQLMPPEVFAPRPPAEFRWSLPCVEIEDRPRFGWRGSMLDTGRYFMAPEFVKKYIDLLAMHKLNRFHWHLTEDQGWRIEIKKYPRLTEIGAWRAESIVGHYRDRPRRYDGVRHGGFYTQDDIREIVAYGAERHVTIVPEIEMPGHAQAAIAAYPRLGVAGEPLEVSTVWGVHANIFNPSEETILFLQDVLTEVLDLFPGEFIHIGGDEARKDQWRASPAVQARMRELGLATEDELQSWFIGRMDAFLTERGRRLIGWDEILEGGLASGAAVMAWRGAERGIEAARLGHDVVMAPTSHTYFDYYQAAPQTEPLAIGGLLPLARAYAFDPMPRELAPELRRHILGAQCQLWTEYMPNPAKVEYMAFPRLSAFAEAVWSPAEAKDFEDFSARLPAHLERLGALGVNFRPLDR